MQLGWVLSCSRGCADVVGIPNIQLIMFHAGNIIETIPMQLKILYVMHKSKHLPSYDVVIEMLLSKVTGQIEEYDGLQDIYIELLVREPMGRGLYFS